MLRLAGYKGLFSLKNVVGKFVDHRRCPYKMYIIQTMTMKWKSSKV